MKLLLPLLLICFITIDSQAQTEIMDLKKLKESTNYLQLFRNKTAAAQTNKDSLLNLVKGKLFLKGAKPGVYRLPKDGMPCVVPDTKDIAAIPNGWKGKTSVPYVSNEPRIPNLALSQSFLLRNKNISATIVPDKK